MSSGIKRSMNGGREVISFNSHGMLNTVAGHEVAKAMVVIRPFLLWPLIALIGFLLHHFWPANVYVIMFLGSFTAMMAGFVWFLTRTRHKMGYVHGILTTVFIGVLLCCIDGMGWNKFAAFAMLMGIPALCLTWSIRGAIREGDSKQNIGLNELFESAGLHPDTKMTFKKPKAAQTEKRPVPGFLRRFSRTKPEPAPEPVDPDGKVRRERVDRRLRGRLTLQPGQTADDAMKRAANIESAAGWPPGTLIVTQNEDNRSHADIVISDPRILKRPVPWEGPSYINGSIADPVSVGMYQDGTEAYFNITEVQVQIMGMTGSGKSLGGAWSSLSDAITRKDVVIWAVDIAKGMQTLGGLAPAIHRIETTPDGAKQLLADVMKLIKPRTDYLSDKGYGKWREGCGLNYLIVWLEEVPEIMDAIGDMGQERWVKAVRTARSAGITFVWSLQRADFTQVPTISRGQAVKWCFGVADSHEASFGLSETQKARDCEPELWNTRRPGMSYLDAPSVPDDRIAMPLRCWYFGEDDSLIRAHALKYPASARPYDSLMVEVLSRSGNIGSGANESDEEKEDDLSDVDPELREDLENAMKVSDEELDAEARPAGIDNDFALGSDDESERLSPSEARLVVRNWLVSQAGTAVDNASLTDVRLKTGYGRSWQYKVMREFVESGLVTRDDGSEGIVWVVTDDPARLSQEG